MIARYAPKAQRAPPAPRPSIDIVRALEDKLLLGAALGDPVTWSRWLSVLRAAFALPMSTSDVAAFKEVTGNREPPTGRVDQLWATVGRRSGKSRIAAALAVFAAAFIRVASLMVKLGTYSFWRQARIKPASCSITVWASCRRRPS